MTVSPGHFADRPAGPADLVRSPALSDELPAPGTRTLGPDAVGRTHDMLSELLRSVRLSGEQVIAYAPPPIFSIGFSGTGSLHIVEAGECVLRIDGDPSLERLSTGDVVLLPRGDSHHISETDRRAAIRSESAETEATECVRWLCGTFTIGDPRASHLLESLPAAIVLRSSGGPALEGLAVAHRMLGYEMESPSQGSAVMIARILDLIFIQILRAWAASADAEPNWLAAALDPQTGPALSAIHRDPGRDWTVEDLARACGLSRSAFAARFAAHVGQPPVTYLAHVRLDTATTLLRETASPISLIAKKVGYTSEAAFSRAFKNRYGLPPAHWRQDRPVEQG